MDARRGPAPARARAVRCRARRPAPIAGGSPEADAGTAPAPPRRGRAHRRVRAAPEVTAVAVLFAAASVFFGVFPSALFNLAAHAGARVGLT